MSLGFKRLKTYTFRLDGCKCKKMGREMQTISHYSCQVIVVVSFVSCCFDMYSFTLTSPISVQLCKESSGSEWCAAVEPSIATHWNPPLLHSGTLHCYAVEPEFYIPGVSIQIEH